MVIDALHCGGNSGAPPDRSPSKIATPIHKIGDSEFPIK